MGEEKKRTKINVFTIQKHNQNLKCTLNMYVSFSICLRGSSKKGVGLVEIDTKIRVLLY